ncbi:MAG: nitrile hydratase accessory protein [Myxococcota bacterium]
MPDPKLAVALDSEGRAAPPRRNGELVFETPWEGRLFGITMALHEAGHFEWEEFRALLIQEIARWERAAAERPDAEWSYYRHWQAALETLLARKGLAGQAELDDRARSLAARPAGHDH